METCVPKEFEHIDRMSNKLETERLYREKLLKIVSYTDHSMVPRFVRDEIDKSDKKIISLSKILC